MLSDWLLLSVICIPDVTLPRLKAFIPQLLSRLHIEVLLHGNITKEVCHTVFIASWGSLNLVSCTHNSTAITELEVLSNMLIPLSQWIFHLFLLSHPQPLSVTPMVSQRIIVKKLFWDPAIKSHFICCLSCRSSCLTPCNDYSVTVWWRENRSH